VPTPVTVTATQGGSTANGLLLRVKVLTGAAASQTGNTGSNSSSTPFTPGLSLTTTVTGSYVYGALANGSPITNGTAFTAAAGNTLLDSYADSTNAEQYGTCRTTTKTGTPGATTVGASLPLITGGIAFAEILPDAGGLSEDPSSPTAAVSTSGTSVSASFTPPDGALLVAMVSSDGGSAVTTMALSGGGLTWSPLAEANGSGNDYAGVWIAQVPPSNPFDPVITATQGGSTAAGIALRIYVLIQAAATQNGGTSNNQFLNATSFTQSVTTTQTGSRVYGASAVFGNNSATAAAATTVADNIADTVNNGRYVTFKATALTGTPGATTLGFTVASSSGPFAQAEILSAGTLTEDNSAPPPVSDTGNTFVSCANFSPPGGSLLVALVSSDGGAAVTTMTVSGGGLTWTELVKNNPSAGDYAGVWIAQVQAAGGGVTQARPGQTWLRRFHHRQQILAPAPAPATPAAVAPARDGPVQARQLSARGGRVTRRAGVYGQAGPPARALPGPVQARAPLPPHGRAAGRAGVYGGTGPALRVLAQAVAAWLRVLPPRGRAAGARGSSGGTGPAVRALGAPVRASRQQQPPGGRAAGRAGTFTATAVTSGAPVYPLHGAVQARRLPQRGGRVTRAARAPTVAPGPALKPPAGPARAPQPLPRRGTASGRGGTFTAVSLTSGAPVYPLGHPAAARRLPARGGSVSHRAGLYAGTGPLVPALKQPLGVYRQQPPPPARGRVLSLHGTPQGTGPPVPPLHRPVRARWPYPVLPGRVRATLQPRAATLPPPFTIGTLAGNDAPAGVLTAAGASSTLTASTAASGTLTATDQRIGGPA